MALSFGRRLGLPLAVLIAGFALAGCAGLPAGVDGNLTNDWPAMAQAKISVPVSGACYYGEPTGVSPGDDPTVQCSEPHGTETVFVGAFTGADETRSSPPAKGGEALANAFAACRKNATDYLGDDFAMGAMELSLVLPTTAAWNGGARWFRCDLTQYTDLNFDQLWKADKSAKDGLRGNRPLAVTCINATDDGKGSIYDRQPVDCAKPHNGELAGLFTAPDVPWPTDPTAAQNLASKGCEAVVAKYLGLSGTQVDNPVLGWAYDDFTQDRWQLGDRTVRCAAIGFKGESVNGVKFTGSVKGIGSKAPKP